MFEMFELIKQFPNSGLRIGEVIGTPDDRFIYPDKDETHCGADYFRFWSEYFKEVTDDD